MLMHCGWNLQAFVQRLIPKGAIDVNVVVANVHSPLTSSSNNKLSIVCAVIVVTHNSIHVGHTWMGQCHKEGVTSHLLDVAERILGLDLEDGGFASLRIGQ